LKRLNPKKTTQYGILRNTNISPISVTTELFGDNKVLFSDESQVGAFCLNCISHPCIDYDYEVLKPDILTGMPHNLSTKVCPIDSIKIGDDGFPQVDSSSCIGCGICLSRCKYGAINLTCENKATVNRGNHQHIDWVEDISFEDFQKREAIFSQIELDYLPNIISKKYFNELYSKILSFCKSNNGADNYFVRNIFLNLGFNTKVRVIGNNDIRFDLIGMIENSIVIGEIGLNGTDILEEPRAILDDVAVLQSRYGFEINSIKPVIITLSFPNKRSDVYEVIYDIQKILSIRISTISFHILILLNLFRKKVNLNEMMVLFYVDKDNKSILEATLKVFPDIIKIDPYYNSEFYQAIK
jgi:NAD-dependent dihydropyrimidine dehydrogenase PreA subunit